MRSIRIEGRVQEWVGWVCEKMGKLKAFAILTTTMFYIIINDAVCCDNSDNQQHILQEDCKRYDNI